MDPMSFPAHVLVDVMHTSTTTRYFNSHNFDTLAVSREVIQKPTLSLELHEKIRGSHSEDWGWIQHTKDKTRPPASVYLSSPTMAECSVQSLLVAFFQVPL